MSKNNLPTNTPEKIYLDLGYYSPHALAHDFNDLINVTWSKDNASGSGVEYVRADIAELSKPSENLVEEIEKVLLDNNGMFAEIISMSHGKMRRSIPCKNVASKIANLAPFNTELPAQMFLAGKIEAEKEMTDKALAFGQFIKNNQILECENDNGKIDYRLAWDTEMKIYTISELFGSEQFETYYQNRKK